MRKNNHSEPPSVMPTESDVREYAYHLYVESGYVPGRDLDNWLEAEACLCANIPKEESHTRLHRHLSRSSSAGQGPRFAAHSRGRQPRT